MRVTGKRQEALADAFGVDQKAISLWATGKREPIFSSVQKIRAGCSKIGINADWLLDGNGTMFGDVSDNASSQNAINVPCLTVRASAGRGAHIFNLDDFSAKGTIPIAVAFFKTKPPTGLMAMQVDGFSMIPTLLPDSWVVFNGDNEYSGEGLYVIRWDDELLVKIIQKDRRGAFDILSTNKEYKSWRVEIDDQEGFGIIGKVLKVVL
jgi:phage repressor protein C with HTH and peptisase S24 domain